MKIYIAYNYEKQVIGVLLSDKREKADIAWAGMDLAPYTVEEIDPKEATGIHGVTFLLTSVQEEIYVDGRFKTFIHLTRGL